MDAYRVPGMSVAIIEEGRIAAKGYGYARLPSTPATADTLWFTESTTQAFTAAAAGILIDDETQYLNLKWTSPLHDYMPADLATSEDYITKDLSFEDAFSHRSGLPSYDGHYGWGNNSLLDHVKMIRHLPLTAGFRTVYQFCDAMVMAASKALEIITGEPVSALACRLLWQPIGMTSTFFFPAELDRMNASHVKERLARGYHWIPDRFSGDREAYYVPEPYMDLSVVSGAGAAVSSVSDYALWVKTLLDADFLSNIRHGNHSVPIESLTYMELVTQRIPVLGNEPVDLGFNDFRRPDGYALGWITSEIYGVPLIMHRGSLTGFGTAVWMVPGLRTGLVIISNTKDRGVAATLIALAVFKTKFRSNKVESAVDETPPCVSIHGSAVAESPILQESEGLFSNQAAEHTLMHTTETEAAGAFIGTYYHPAYGTFTVSLASTHAPAHFAYMRSQESSSSSNSNSAVSDLLVQLSKRTWPAEYYLRHDAESWFQAVRWVLHGTYADDAVNS